MDDPLGEDDSALSFNFVVQELGVPVRSDDDG